MKISRRPQIAIDEWQIVFDFCHDPARSPDTPAYHLSFGIFKLIRMPVPGVVTTRGEHYIGFLISRGMILPRVKLYKQFPGHWVCEIGYWGCTATTWYEAIGYAIRMNVEHWGRTIRRRWFPTEQEIKASARLNQQITEALRK